MIIPIIGYKPPSDYKSDLLSRQSIELVFLFGSIEWKMNSSAISLSSPMWTKLALSSSVLRLTFSGSDWYGSPEAVGSTGLASAAAGGASSTSDFNPFRLWLFLRERFSRRLFSGCCGYKRRKVKKIAMVHLIRRSICIESGAIKSYNFNDDTVKSWS